MPSECWPEPDDDFEQRRADWLEAAATCDGSFLFGFDPPSQIRDNRV